MDASAVDFPALSLALLVAALITAALALALRGGTRRRVWLTAAGVAVILLAIGLADLLRETPRETHLATLFIGVPLPILGAVGLLPVTRRVRGWLRWTLVFVTAFVLLLAGLLIGAAIAPRFLPF